MTFHDPEKYQKFAVRVKRVGSIIYVGQAAIGSDETAPVWRIKRFDVTEPDVSLTWADGDQDFDNRWDQRAILTYL